MNESTAPLPAGNPDLVRPRAHVIRLRFPDGTDFDPALQPVYQPRLAEEQARALARFLAGPRDFTTAAPRWMWELLGDLEFDGTDPAGARVEVWRVGSGPDSLNGYVRLCGVLVPGPGAVGGA